MNDIITLEQNMKDVYEKKTESALLRSKGNCTKKDTNLQNIFINWKNLKIKKNFGVKSNVKIVHINLISILLSMNKLSFMKKYLKRKGGMKEGGLSFEFCNRNTSRSREN